MIAPATGRTMIEAATAAAPVAADAAPAQTLAAADGARTLGLWLLALRSFFNLRNQPLTETERAQVLTYDFTHELQIAQQALWHCTQLLLTLQTEAAPARTQPAAAVPEVGWQAQAGALNLLLEMLADASGLCDALLAGPGVGSQAWGSFGRMLAREFEQDAAATELMEYARAQSLLQQQPDLFALVERLAPDTLGADMNAIFNQLTLMLAQLRHIEALLRRDAPLKQVLPLFTLVHEETRGLIELIERRALRTGELSAVVYDVLDSTGYAIGMELCKVFAHELVGLAAQRQPPAIYTKVENAHGLLRDCFQQTVVVLAQVFDPTFAGTQLFQTFSTKLEQSLALRRDVWGLLQLIRSVEREGDAQAWAAVPAHINAFQEGSMRHLMYKDWEPFERFGHEVQDARGAAELTPVLHRFGTFLETLFGQINMRAVLAEHPFDPNAA